MKFVYFKVPKLILNLQYNDETNLIRDVAMAILADELFEDHDEVDDGDNDAEKFDDELEDE